MLFLLIFLWCYLHIVITANYKLITSRSQLTSSATATYSPKHSINWDQFGSPPSTFPNPNVVSSSNNDFFTIRKSIGFQFEIRKQVDVSSVCDSDTGDFRTDIDLTELLQNIDDLPEGYWIGNFEVGDFVLKSLLDNEGSSNQNPIQFVPTDSTSTYLSGEGLVAIGTQIQVNILDESHIVQIDIYDISFNHLQTFSTSATSGCFGDGSAQFIGIQSERSFYYAHFSVASGADNKGSYAINTVEYVSRDCSDPYKPIFSCIWYNDCLERYSFCGSDGYAIGYGLHFCTRYTQNAPQFTALGQQWINQVKQCLQLELVPIYNTLSDCTSVLEYACDSHPNCYLGTAHVDVGDISVCDLDYEDWINIVKTVWGGLTGCGWQQIIATGLGCGNQWSQYLVDILFDLVQEYTIDLIQGFSEFALEFVNTIISSILSDLWNNLANPLVPFYMEVFSGSLGIRFVFSSGIDQCCDQQQLMALMQEINEQLRNQTYDVFNTISNETYAATFRNAQQFTVTDDYVNRWMFPYGRETVSTTQPTSHPTTTTNPSYYPTTIPTIYPTEVSENPSYYPTTMPTIHPTIYPSEVSDNPSYYPSAMPIINPVEVSDNPSYYPTTIPTIHPSEVSGNPSYYPTAMPTIHPTVFISQCNINGSCRETKDCCSGLVKERDLGIKCSRSYKGRSYSTGDKGCCIKRGYPCSNDNQCCKKKACYKGLCKMNLKIKKINASK